MIAYLIECGNHHIIYVKELQSYCIADTHALTIFNAHTPNFIDLDAKEKFQYELNERFTDNTGDIPIQHTVGSSITDETLLQHFYDPTLNSGAVIAIRDSEKEKPQILHKYRYQKLTCS